MDGDYARNRIIGSVGFHNDWNVRYPVRQNGGGSEGDFQKLEGSMAVVGEDPGYSLAGESGQGNHDIRVFMDKPPIEVGET
jgi:hypothetical protein